MKQLAEFNSNLMSTFSKRLATIRILFGLIWAIDAAFKFEPVFYRGLLTYIKATDSGEPSWLNPWFHMWYRIIGVNPHLTAVVIIILEVFIALSLLLGVARRLNYAGGVIFSFLIWGVGEGFGGPYVSGSTDIGAGFIYVVVFMFLYVSDSIVAPTWSLDPYLETRISWWHYISNSKLTFTPKESTGLNGIKKKVVR